MINLKERFKLFILLILLIVHSVGCEGQVESKTVEVTEIKMVDTFVMNTLIQADSLNYNKYKNGQKEGWWKEFDENNQLITEGYYENGKANGLMKWYHEGVLVAFGNMKDDKRNGLWKVCDIYNIKNCIEATFENDEKVGIWKVLHDNGKVSKEQEWEHGKMVGEKCFDEKGNSIKCEVKGFGL